MKYYIIAGEASGDLHGHNLIKELKKIDSSSEFRCWGGDLIKKETGYLVKHFKDSSYMGFLEVIVNLPKIFKNLNFCKKDILKYNPDLIIYIDYPGFNMRIARWAKKHNFINHFYISPQIWAWKEYRINLIKKVIDKMYVILPFEKNFYEQKHNYKVEFVGHPLIDAISKKENYNKNKFISKNCLSSKPIIALLPGSREQEINKLLPLMLSQVNKFKEYQFVIAAAPSRESDFYEKILIKYNLKNQVSIVFNETYNLFRSSHAALVTSGTATLETALFKVPQVVCYKTSWFSFSIGKLLIKNIKYISLPNLILGKKIVSELIQNQCTKLNISIELIKILDNNKRTEIIDDYKKLENKLGGIGASKKTASAIYDYSNSETNDS